MTEYDFDMLVIGSGPAGQRAAIAHVQSFVHRGIKPSNIMLENQTGTLRPVLTDFGIAEIAGGHTLMTQTGGVLGKFDYIAPEQIHGAADVDGRVEVYAIEAGHTQC